MDRLEYDENHEKIQGQVWRLQAKLAAQQTKSIEHMQQCLDELTKEVQDIKICVAKLKTAFEVKTGVWGLIGGAIPAGVILAWTLLKS